MGALPPSPRAAILIAAAPASLFLKTGKLGYHRGASWIKSAFPKVSSAAAIGGDQAIGSDQRMPASRYLMTKIAPSTWSTGETSLALPRKILITMYEMKPNPMPSETE